MLRVGFFKLQERCLFSKALRDPNTLNLKMVKAEKKPEAVRLPVTGMSINPYAFFIKEKLSDSTTATDSAIKEMAAIWKNIDKSEKEKYQKMSKEYREKKIAEFLKLSEGEREKIIQESIEHKQQKALRKERKEKRAEKERKGIPSQPPNSYALFIKQEMEDAKSRGDKNVVEIMKTGAKKWKDLNESQRKPYNEKAKKLSDEYFKKLEEAKKHSE